MMTIFDRPGLDWTVVLRRRPSRLAAGEPEGGYTNMFEIIYCDCDDDPDLDYRRSPPGSADPRTLFSRDRVAAYAQHLQQRPSRSPGARAAPGRTGRRSLAGRGRRE